MRGFPVHGSTAKPESGAACRWLLEAVPAPLLYLDAGGVLRAANRPAHALVPTLAAWLDRPLADALAGGETLAQHLREARGSSQALPLRLRWQVPEAGADLLAALSALPAEAPGGGGFLLLLKPHADLARRFVSLREKMDQLDAEIERRRRAEEALREREAWLRVVLASIADAVVTADTGGRVTWMNPAAEALTGWTLAEANGQPIQRVMDLVDENTGAAAPNPLLVAIGERRPTGMLGDTALQRRDGTTIAVEDTASPIFDEQARLVGGVIVFHDVTEKRRLAREMAERATHDALTGLYNRFELDSRLARALEDARRSGDVHALLYLDLDHFKLVNDTAGHAAGDLLLQQLVGLLESAVRSSDTIARLGGDEFGILLPGCGQEAALRVAQELLGRLAAFRFEHEGRRFRIGASIGIALVDGRWSDCGEVLQAADTACYAAKEAGGQQVRLWQEAGEAADARGRMVWAQRLTDALEEDRFELHLQRIERLRDSPGPAHAEALLRMRDEAGGLVMPGDFLPAAERFRIAPAIDRHVLERVVAALRADPRARVEVAVNLSGQSIGSRAFRDAALALLREAGSAIAGRLCVEVTETAVITHLMEAGRFAAQLRDLGVAVALDDFGAGSSSFGYLRQLPIDYLKIDGQFVEGLPSDRLGATAVGCFVEAARVVGARSIAERVETGEVLDALRLLGVDFVQGYHLHRPEPWEGVWARLPRLPAARGIA